MAVRYTGGHMASTTPREFLHCEQTQPGQGDEGLTFITAVLPEGSGSLLRIESHVFIEATNVHLHEVTFLHKEDQAQPEILRAATRRPHQLLADHQARSTRPIRSPQRYLTQTLASADLPIRRWLDEGRFTAALLLLPDITAATRLRDAVLPG